MSVPRDLQGWFKGVSREFQKSFMAVSWQFQKYLKEVLRVVKESVQCVSRKFHKMSQACFKNVSINFGFPILLLHESHCSFPSRWWTCLARYWPKYQNTTRKSFQKSTSYVICWIKCLSTHEKSWALMSTQEYGAMLPWALFRAHKWSWRHCPMLMNASEHSWVFLSVHWFSWELMSVHESSWELKRAYKHSLVVKSAQKQ